MKSLLPKPQVSFEGKELLATRPKRDYSEDIKLPRKKHSEDVARPRREASEDTEKAEEGIL